MDTTYMETPSNIEMKALKRWLDKGDIERIAKQANISKRQASNIISGRNKNFVFLRLLIETAEQNMALAKRTEVLKDNFKILTNGKYKD